MKITAAEKSKKNKGRISIYLDGSYAFSMDESDYLSMNLYEEREMSADEVEHIKINVNYSSAKSDAVKFMALSLRTQKEVSDKLESRGYESSVIDRVIEELKSIGYINDRIYAQKFVFDRSKLKPKSKKMLMFELSKKGIEEEIINEVLNDWEIDDESVAEGLLKKKFGKYDLDDVKYERRAFAFLSHRGYSFELIQQLINKYRKNCD